jgi:hypothetical protein
MDDGTFLWWLPVLVAVAVIAQLSAGRAVVGWTPKGWEAVDKTDNAMKYWLFITAEIILMLILVGQALWG